MSEARKAIRTVPLRCSCGCTFARVREDATLVIVSRHHGRECVNVLTQSQILKLSQEASRME